MPGKPVPYRLAALAGLLVSTLPALADDLAPGSWHIVSVGGLELPLDRDRMPSFEIGMDSTSFSATLGCNRFGGSLTITKASVTFGPVMSTRMACQPPLDMLESAFGAALETSRSFAVDGDMVTFSDVGGAGLLVLVRPH